jgi:hypothetical protein
MRLILGQSFDATEELIHPVRDVSQPPIPTRGSVDWWGWQQLRGGGCRSFLRWLLAMGEVTYAESIFVTHLFMEGRGECHTWGGTRFCYCDDPEPDGTPPRLAGLIRLRRTA